MKNQIYDTEQNILVTNESLLPQGHTNKPPVLFKNYKQQSKDVVQNQAQNGTSSVRKSYQQQQSSKTPSKSQNIHSSLNNQNIILQTLKIENANVQKSIAAQQRINQQNKMIQEEQQKISRQKQQSQEQETKKRRTKQFYETKILYNVTKSGEDTQTIPRNNVIVGSNQFQNSLIEVVQSKDMLSNTGSRTIGTAQNRDRKVQSRHSMTDDESDRPSPFAVPIDNIKLQNHIYQNKQQKNDLGRNVYSPDLQKTLLKNEVIQFTECFDSNSNQKPKYYNLNIQPQANLIVINEKQQKEDAINLGSTPIDQTKVKNRNLDASESQRKEEVDGMKKQKKNRMIIFDKEHISRMQNSLQTLSPKLEDNLKIKKIKINQAKVNNSITLTTNNPISQTFQIAPQQESPTIQNLRNSQILNPYYEMRNSAMMQNRDNSNNLSSKISLNINNINFPTQNSNMIYNQFQNLNQQLDIFNSSQQLLMNENKQSNQRENEMYNEFALEPMTAIQNFQMQNDSNSTDNDKKAKNLNLIQRNMYLNSEKISKTDFNIQNENQIFNQENNHNDNRESDVASQQHLEKAQLQEQVDFQIKNKHNKQKGKNQIVQSQKSQINIISQFSNTSKNINATFRKPVAFKSQNSQQEQLSQIQNSDAFKDSPQENLKKNNIKFQENIQNPKKLKNDESIFLNSNKFQNERSSPDLIKANVQVKHILSSRQKKDQKTDETKTKSKGKYQFQLLPNLVNQDPFIKKTTFHVFDSKELFENDFDRQDQSSVFVGWGKSTDGLQNLFGNAQRIIDGSKSNDKKPKLTTQKKIENKVEKQYSQNWASLTKSYQIDGSKQDDQQIQKKDNKTNKDFMRNQNLKEQILKAIFSNKKRANRTQQGIVGKQIQIESIQKKAQFQQQILNIRNRKGNLSPNSIFDQNQIDIQMILHENMQFKIHGDNQKQKRIVKKQLNTEEGSKKQDNQMNNTFSQQQNRKDINEQNQQTTNIYAQDSQIEEFNSLESNDPNINQKQFNNKLKRDISSSNESKESVKIVKIEGDKYSQQNNIIQNQPVSEQNKVRAETKSNQIDGQVLSVSSKFDNQKNINIKNEIGQSVVLQPTLYQDSVTEESRIVGSKIRSSIHSQNETLDALLLVYSQKPDQTNYTENKYYNTTNREREQTLMSEQGTEYSNQKVFNNMVNRKQLITIQDDALRMQNLSKLDENLDTNLFKSMNAAIRYPKENLFQRNNQTQLVQQNKTIYDHEKKQKNTILSPINLQVMLKNMNKEGNFNSNRDSIILQSKGINSDNLKQQRLIKYSNKIFLSLKERQEISNQYREQTVSNVRNQIASDIERMTNQQLFAAKVNQLPKFGLFSTDFTSRTNQEFNQYEQECSQSYHTKRKFNNTEINYMSENNQDQSKINQDLSIVNNYKNTPHLKSPVQINNIKKNFLMEPLSQIKNTKSKQQNDIKRKQYKSIQLERMDQMYQNYEGNESVNSSINNPLYIIRRGEDYFINNQLQQLNANIRRLSQNDTIDQQNLYQRDQQFKQYTQEINYERQKQFNNKFMTFKIPETNQQFSKTQNDNSFLKPQSPVTAIRIQNSKPFTRKSDQSVKDKIYIEQTTKYYKEMSFKEEDEDLYSDNNEDRHLLGEKMKNIRDPDLTSQRAPQSAKLSELNQNKESQQKNSKMTKNERARMSSQEHIDSERDSMKIKRQMNLQKVDSKLVNVNMNKRRSQPHQPSTNNEKIISQKSKDRTVQGTHQVISNNQGDHSRSNVFSKYQQNNLRMSQKSSQIKNNLHSQNENNSKTANNIVYASDADADFERDELQQIKDSQAYILKEEEIQKYYNDNKQKNENIQSNNSNSVKSKLIIDVEDKRSSIYNDLFQNYDENQQTNQGQVNSQNELQITSRANIIKSQEQELQNLNKCESIEQDEKVSIFIKYNENKAEQNMEPHYFEKKINDSQIKSKTDQSKFNINSSTKKNIVEWDAQNLISLRSGSVDLKKVEHQQIKLFKKRNVSPTKQNIQIEDLLKTGFDRTIIHSILNKQK